MSHNALPIIETLFARHGELRQPVDFEWRLIYRYRRPFLLLPASIPDARAGLKIYSPQRQRAKIWRALVPLLFKLPTARLFQRVQFQADAASEIMQFMAEQAARPATRITAVAIMFSGMDYKSRVTLLLCDEDKRPVRIIKAGLNPEWKKVTDREADILERLPPNLPGWGRITGRLSTPGITAFAMEYLEGKSPQDDAAMESLFHAWLNPAPPEPLENLALWRSLAAQVTYSDLSTWHILKVALAGKKIRTTLFHGDFSPWNIRITDARQVLAFDWERADLQGIPGWDWFHFIIQSSILAKRHSAVRAAAEVEQLIHSPRFMKYAEEAEITDVIQPLLLAYLLHYLWTFRPLEGDRTTRELFDLLFENWQSKPVPAPVATPAPPPAAAPGVLAAAQAQLKSALAMWSNLFWEPHLNFQVPPPLSASLKTQWPFGLFAGLLMATVVTIQYFSSANMIFLPFYLAICALLTWKTDRRWGAVAAMVAAVAGPLVVALRHPEYRTLELGLWNSVIRFLILQSCVLFVDRIHRQQDLVNHRSGSAGRIARLGENWAVILASGVLLAVVAWLDLACNPRMTFMPFYLFPCMLIGLVLNLRWSLVAAVLAVFTGTFIESMTLDDYPVKIFIWNLSMRLSVFLVVIVLLQLIRRENILFVRRKN
jgi:hypothetical protein